MYNKHLWGYFALLEQDSDANIYFMIESAERVLICWFSSTARQKKKSWSTHFLLPFFKNSSSSVDEIAFWPNKYMWQKMPE